MRIVAVIQARMGSTRLPGKVLMDLGGSTVLARVVKRLRRSRLISQIVVATTTSSADDRIAGDSRGLCAPCFRGSEDDVLGRYYAAAQAYNAEVVVRITGDCPLIDPAIVDRTIEFLHASKADYAANDVPRTFPRGLDTEVFTMSSLGQAWRQAREPYQREHVTPYFYQHPEIFRIASLVGEADCSRYRWTLDTEDDLRLLRAVYLNFRNTENFGCAEVLALLKRSPELGMLNGGVVQKSLQGLENGVEKR
jgi:spore coat polysaccharide biosynthesis protein SpsF